MGVDASWRRIPPAAVLLVVLLIGLSSCAAAVAYLASRPSLGLSLAPDAGADTVRIEAAEARVGLPPGDWTLAGLAASTAPGEPAPVHWTLTALDRLEEPDLLPDYATQDVFLARQTAIAAMLAEARDAGRQVVLHVRDDAGRTLALPVVPGPRPVSSLPETFWVQWGAVLFGLMLGTWVWVLRPRDLPTRAFAFTGVGLFLGAASASLYSSRELALDGGLIRGLSIVNHLGAGLFAAAAVTLFLCYPVRLVPTRWLAWPGLVFGTLFVLDSLRWLPTPAWGSWYVIVLAVAALIVCVCLQWRATRDDPVARAPVRWIGLSTLVTAGAVCALMLPSWLFGAGAGLEQGWAFGLSALIYLGLAIAVRRHRLFDLDVWAYRLLLYVGATLLLILVDAVLVYGLHVAAVPSLTLSLIIVGFLYLPLRNVFWTRMVARSRLDENAIFRGVLDIVLAEGAVQRAGRWQALLERMFQPLECQRVAHGASAAEGDGQWREGQAALDEEGLSMRVPDGTGGGYLRLRYPWKGRGLFGSAQLQQVRQLTDLLRHAEESRQAFARGAEHERHRIAGDLHDDIGAALLSGLHQSDVKVVHQTLRDVMGDIRSIVTGLTGQAETVAGLLAALRYETAERLDAAGLALDWQMPELPETLIAYAQVKHVRSCLREAVSNILRHAGARRVTVRVALAGGGMSISVRDDGRGAGQAARPAGHGLGGMRERMAELGGTAAFEPGVDGSTLVLQWPLAAGAPA